MVRVIQRSGRIRLLLSASFLLLGIAGAALAQERPMLVGLGDSIGEGVQAADANEHTQPASYLNWIAFKMQAAFPLPLIRSSAIGVVGDTDPARRRRISPGVASLNLAVSGADIEDLLDDRADATTTDAIDDETDLVLFPRLGSQMEIAETLDPELLICWIGSNDVLGAVTSWDELNATQMTSEAEFAERFSELGERLGALQSKVVIANVPDVTKIGFAVTAEDLRKFTGSDHGLPQAGAGGEAKQRQPICPGR